MRTSNIVLSIVIFLVTNSHASVPKPSALSVPVRSDWFGWDGQWSPVSIRVGTSPQWVNLFVSTASQETLVVGYHGCDGVSECTDKRGGIFTPNTSTSWVDQGAFDLGLDTQLGFEGQGSYGLDSIALSDTISVPSQIVGVFNDSDNFLLGMFGLGVKPTNLTAVDVKTFLDSVVENKSLVPSHSYGYTAGARNRLKGVPASLTLGGYDANRFRPHNVSFDLDSDQNPVVAINQITATAAPLPSSNTTTGWNDESTDLLVMSQADLFTIDSTTPFLWLPEAVCLQFEKELGLSYDGDLELYTFPKNSSHDNLVNWNISFTFTLADLPGSSKTVSLTVPYSAFDLQLSYPYPPLATRNMTQNVNYFPVRKAKNSTQYTLGRTFLQEAYLIVDYERNNFSVHPAIFAQDALTNMDLIDITRPKNSTMAGPQLTRISHLSSGTIAGIVVAAIVGLGFLICLLLVFRKIRRDHPDDGYVREKEEAINKPWHSRSHFFRWLFCLPLQQQSSEIDGSRRYALEAPNDREVLEIGGKESGGGSNSELEGSDTEVRGYYERDNKDAKKSPTVINAIGHDPSIPVELPYRSSNYQSGTGEDLDQEPIPIPSGLNFSRPGVPNSRMVQEPPTRHGTQKSAAVSSPSESGNSKAESDRMHIVSPITPPDDSPQFSSLDSIARRAAWFISNDSPSVSSESHGGTERSPPGTMSIDERAGFPTSRSRQDTISSMDPTYTSGSLSQQMTVSPQESPASHTRAPRNSRATAMTRAGSPSSGHRSTTSTVTNEIRHSVHRGFNWVPATNQPEVPHLVPRTPVTANSEQSPYSPARWIEFWKTGRDPRLGPARDRTRSTGS